MHSMIFPQYNGRLYHPRVSYLDILSAQPVRLSGLLTSIAVLEPPHLISAAAGGNAAPYATQLKALLTSESRETYIRNAINDRAFLVQAISLRILRRKFASLRTIPPIAPRAHYINFRRRVEIVFAGIVR